MLASEPPAKGKNHASHTDHANRKLHEPNEATRIPGDFDGTRIVDRGFDDRVITPTKECGVGHPSRV